jgi:ParB/RepB/Spo0J family partition protein
MTRKPLGRGLGALIGGAAANEETADTSPSNFIDVPVHQVVPSPFQPRRHFDAERLRELADAIRAQGIIEPLVVRMVAQAGLGDPRYELVAGERRLRAAREAGLETVPVVVRDFDDRTALEVSLVENLAREDLGAADEARALMRLAREFGLSHEQIALRIAFRSNCGGQRNRGAGNFGPRRGRDVPPSPGPSEAFISTRDRCSSPSLGGRPSTRAQAQGASGQGPGQGARSRGDRVLQRRRFDRTGGDARRSIQRQFADVRSLGGDQGLCPGIIHIAPAPCVYRPPPR